MIIITYGAGLTANFAIGVIDLTVNLFIKDILMVLKNILFLLDFSASIGLSEQNDWASLITSLGKVRFYRVHYYENLC